MKVTVTVEQAREFRAAMKTVRRNLGPFSRGRGPFAMHVLGEVGEFESKQNRSTFASQGKKSGRKWAALKKTPKGSSYWERKRKEFPGRKILTRTGRLRDSLGQVKHPDRIQRKRGKWMEFGTRVPYALPHQKGWTTVNGIKRPARPPVRKSRRQMEALSRVVQRSFLGFLASRTSGSVRRSLNAIKRGIVRPRPSEG